MEEYTYGGGNFHYEKIRNFQQMSNADAEVFWREPKRFVRRFVKWFVILGMIWPIYVLIWHLVQ